MSEFVGNKEVFKCSKCKCKNFLEDFGLNRLEQRYKTCIKCREKRKKTRNKSDAKRRKRAIRDKEFECKECKQCFGRKEHLEQHIKTVHLKIKDNICPYDKCIMSFSRKDSLINHINQVHLNIKNFFCKDCNFSSYFKTDLQTHIKTVHLKIRDNFCPYDKCDYSYSRKSKITEHIKTVHLNIKNFFCKDCQYSSYQKIHLQKHQNYHCNKGDDSEQGSAGEKFIKYVLKKLNTSYLFDKTFDNIRSSTGKGDVRFDFVLYSDSDCPFFIEFDGEQHYRKNNWFGRDGKFEILKANDKIKDDYCEENYYPMLRIKYDTPFDEIERIVTDFVI